MPDLMATSGSVPERRDEVSMTERERIQLNKHNDVLVGLPRVCRVDGSNNDAMPRSGEGLEDAEPHSPRGLATGTGTCAPCC